MSRASLCGLVALILLGGSLELVQAQEESVKLLEPEAARRFLPDRVPMETELVPVDLTRFSALQFPDKSRIAIAGLSAAGFSADFQKKYQFVLVSECRVMLGRWTVPAGMVGLGLEAAAADAPTRSLVLRGFDGSEIDQVPLKLDSAGKEGSVLLVPKGVKGFELHIGRYVVEGTQR